MLLTPPLDLEPYSVAVGKEGLIIGLSFTPLA